MGEGLAGTRRLESPHRQGDCPGGIPATSMQMTAAGEWRHGRSSIRRRTSSQIRSSFRAVLTS